MNTSPSPHGSHTADEAIAALTLLACLLTPAHGTRAQTSAGASDDSTAASDGRTPTGALWRSAVLPGWGQVYNGQIVKAPVIAGAIGGLVVVAVLLNRDYLLYRHAYQYKAYQELVDQGKIEENPRLDYADDYVTVSNRLGRPVSSGPLQTRRDALRRNRDLTILGAGLVWAIGVLDAYVNAHLLDFDVGEDLSVRLAPGLDPDGRPSAAATLVWRPGR